MDETKILAIVALVIAIMGLVLPVQKADSGDLVVKSGIAFCTLKAGDLDTANECVVPFGFTFNQLISVVMVPAIQFGFWNQSYTIFEGNQSLAGLTTGPIGNQSDFIERGYAGIGEMMVHFRSDTLGNCEPSNAFITDQYSSDHPFINTWTSLPFQVKVDCSLGQQIAGGSGLGPGPCSSLSGAGVGAFDCWNNQTLPANGPNGGGTNSTLAKNFQNTFNRLFLSTSAATAIFLYRVDLNLVYGEPLVCSINFSTLSNFTPECGVGMGIELTRPQTIQVTWTAFGT